ncbi:aminoglycoside phosphotransferase family protein [Streptomyces yaizuensis]|uniref:Aminoglycoside phosphotransferase family protein n=1 Tax=Streptomyces yaizuensis TaxID=2989713 RepID=A0ABQ5P9D3_9ACTN|nr:aminoglycoside phosphotransferase family protein [Streptomyces sp. YSPA8]GLF99196.1 aminoglycoside phosphotransferase family protein [Streptomyces sp. YSPA8]
MTDIDTDIDTDIVRTLVAEQFPEWGGLAIRPVARQGWDNRTFRLGDALSVRLPSAERYAAAITKEDGCLPVLAEHLPLPVPVPVATGRPGPGHPFPWSVRRWLPGETVEFAADVDRVRLAHDLGAFLTALRKAPARRGPAGGRHSFYRGCHPSVYGDQVEYALDRLDGTLGGDGTAACRAIWASALTSAWPHPPVWFHGDIAVGNLLTVDGALSSVIDFGTCGTGDPACDLVIAWTHFAGTERRVFREAAGLDDDTWRRARGWALWKALATMAGLSSPDPTGVQSRVLAEVLRDPVVG